MINLFVYGTLMFPEVSRSLAGELSVPEKIIVNGFCRSEATTRDWGNYPYVEGEESESVRGLLFRNVSETQLKIFDWFEGEGQWYDRHTIRGANIFDPGSEGYEFNSDLEFEIYVIGHPLRKHMNHYREINGISKQKVPWDPELFYRKYIGEYFLRSILPTINDPEFVENFGLTRDQPYIDGLIERFKSE